MSRKHEKPKILKGKWAKSSQRINGEWILAAFALFLPLCAARINDTCETVNVGTVLDPEYKCIQQAEKVE